MTVMAELYDASNEHREQEPYPDGHSEGHQESSQRRPTVDWLRSCVCMVDIIDVDTVAGVTLARCLICWWGKQLARLSVGRQRGRCAFRGSRGCPFCDYHNGEGKELLREQSIFNFISHERLERRI